MERKSAYKYLARVYSTTKNDSFRDALSEALSAIRQIEAADTPRRAKWMYGEGGWLVCSDCGFHPTYSLNGRDKKGLSNCRYCPNCGALMMEEKQ